MRSIFPPLKSKPRFPLDLTLLPAGIILLEISVTLTELLKIQPGNTNELLIMRAIHTITLFAIAKAAEEECEREERADRRDHNRQLSAILGDGRHPGQRHVGEATGI